MEDGEENEFSTCKVVILGEPGVGKTSIISRYVTNQFSPVVISTTGASYTTKILKIDDENSIKFQIWDTAGQERFKSITKSFFSGATGVIFVYDITKTDSFFGSTGVKNWIKDSEEYGKFEYILCGNKIDLENKRKVKFDEAKEYSIKKKLIT